jgi:hypothetical protein
MLGTDVGRNIDIIAFDITETRDCFKLVFDRERYVDMRLDRRNCNLGNNNISDYIPRPSKILLHS